MLAAFALALLAAAAWGSADFVAQQVSRRIGFWRTLLGMNWAGALLFALIPAARHLAGLPDAGLWAGLACANTAAGLLFYFALQHGRLALVSPLAATYPIVAVALALTAGHERLSPPAAAAIVAVIAGSTLLGAGAGPGTETAGAREPAALAAAGASAVIFGAVFYEMGVHAGAGAAAPVLLFRLTGAALLTLPLLRPRRPRAPFRRSGFGHSTLYGMLAIGALDTSAYGLYLLAARRLPVALVAPLGSLFTLFSLLLAVAVLRERVGGRRWCGIACILAGLAALALH